MPEPSERYLFQRNVSMLQRLKKRAAEERHHLTEVIDEKIKLLLRALEETDYKDEKSS